MTLTTLLPTLRRSLPDPLRATRWPDHTEATTVDVIIDAISLDGLARLCDTPCVHTGEHTVGHARDGRTVRDDITVVLTRVVHVERLADGLALRLDADLTHADPSWTDLRLIGRASTASVTNAIVVDGLRATSLVPADVTAGDVVAVPCAGLFTRRDIRRGAATGRDR
ncbi:hypothetical protein [Microbacterium marinilacus]|uniref:Uncharacterized protein n=1 Tax=Microbacterium marinilacus TaxID=415209 RepID=A0ABP7BVP5_9MICO|nr:hypothetical protein [Microbacterium marinilacus]MBY0688033.1 hypothetical protein [Microbacterium marinilacus]